MSIAILCYLAALRASKLMVDKSMKARGEENMHDKPEGLDRELYGHLCPELEWMSDEEKEELLSGEMEREMTEDGMAK